MTKAAADFFILPTSTLREAIACIDKHAEGIALVVDPERRLLGTVTDGDMRRAILAGVELDRPVHVLLEERAARGQAKPITAPVGTLNTELLRLMNHYRIRHVPLLDGEGRITDIALMSQLARGYELPLTAVIMAGGFGKRLRPMTDDRPKPMLPVGDKPLLEHIVAQLRTAGIRQVTFTTHYKGELIAQHFGDGKKFGVDISYVKEGQPLGTAGAVNLVAASEEPLLVMNGDVLTRVDFRAMLDFHREHRADMTIAVKDQSTEISYGVVTLDGVRVKDIKEKPRMRYFINAGIYLLSPKVRRFIPADRSSDMPDLISHVITEGYRVVGFPVREYWLDIGKMEDYEQAVADAKKGKLE